MEQQVLPTLDSQALIAGPVFLCFEVDGKPGHKARHRSRLVIPSDAWTGWGPNAFILKPNMRKVYIQQYPDPDTAAYEKMLAQYARILMKSRPPTERPVCLLVHSFRAIPASYTKSERAQALAGYLHPTPRPDWDNYGKITDALNEIVWKDDSQVTDGRVIKRYSDRPGLRIEIREFLPP